MGRALTECALDPKDSLQRPVLCLLLVGLPASLGQHANLLAVDADPHPCQTCGLCELARRASRECAAPERVACR